MFQTYTIFCTVCTPFVVTEDYLKYFPWLQGAINVPKPWFSYIIRFQSNILHQMVIIPNNSHPKIALHHATESAENFHLQSKNIHYKTTGNYCLLAETHTVILPLDNIVFVSHIHETCSTECDDISQCGEKLLDYVRGLGGFFDLEYRFVFRLHTQLRINLSFVYIYIPNMLESCYTNNLEIYQMFGKAALVYCGIHSNFVSCPFSNQVNMTANLKEAYPLKFSFTSSTFAKKLMFSDTFLPRPKLYPMVVHNIIFCGTVISTYRITTHKFMILMLNISIMVGTHLFVHDGPGILSKRMNVSASHTKLNLGTFQCLLQFKELSSKVSLPNIEYKGKTSFQKAIFANNSNSIFIDYPTEICGGFYCVVYLHSSKHYILNITVWNVFYTGPQNRDCNFGGISVLDLFEEVFVFCENERYRKIIDSLWHRVLFTKFSSGILLLHSYKEYSFLSCHINISAANCKLVKLATCGDYQLKVVGMERVFGTFFTLVQSLDPMKCTVVQVSSGLHDKNNMLDLEMSDIYMEYTKGYIYPICRVVELKLDQTKYQQFGAYFQVKSFIEKHDDISEILFSNYEKENKAFQGRITYSEVCSRRGKTSGNISLAKASTFGFYFTQMSEKAKCHVELSAHYHVKTTMTVYKVDFPYLTSNWVVFIVNTSTASFKNVVQVNRVYFPPHTRMKQEVKMYGSFDTKNLALSDTSDKVLNVISKTNLSDVIPLLMKFEAEASLEKIKRRKQFDNVPNILHKIYPKHKRWDSYQYLLQGNENNHIHIALQGSFSSIMIQFVLKQQKPEVQESSRSQQYKEVFFHWINLKNSSQLMTTFHMEKFGHISFFVTRKGKFEFSIPFERIMGHIKGKISWLEAFKYCKLTNLSLSKFFSRDALDELLFLLKESSDLLTITTMFIDLRVKVSHIM